MTMYFRDLINGEVFKWALDHELCTCNRPLTDATFFNVPPGDNLLLVKCAGCGRMGLVEISSFPQGEGMTVSMNIRWLPKVGEVAVVGASIVTEEG